MISINLYEILMQMVNFLILLYLLNKFLIKPLSEFIEKRSSNIKNDIDEASKNRLESEKILADQKQILKDARSEAREVRDKADKIIEQEKQLIITQAKKDAEDVLANAKKEISLSMDKAKKELLNDVGELSVTLAQKVLSKKIDSSEKENLISDGLSSLKVS